MSTIDFGPGQNHIFKRVGRVAFYVPEIFHCSPTYNKRTKLFINDINQSSSIVDIYGALGYLMQKHNYLIINNYPIRPVAVHGRVISCFSKEISKRNNPTLWKKTYEGTSAADDAGADSEKTIFIMRINDFSGRKLTIDCIVKESLYIASGMLYTSPRFQSLIVEVKGEVGVFYGTKEVCVEYLEIVGRTLDDEILKWDEYLTERRVLSEPWIYEPPDSQTRVVHEVCSDSESGTEADEDIVVTNISLINVKSLEDIVCEFIHWILQNNQVKFDLIQLYRDPLLNKLIENYCVHSPKRLSKSDVFHLVRHHIQVECGLILVSKSKNVYCSEAFNVVKYITQELQRVKNGDVDRFLVERTLKKAETLLANRSRGAERKLKSVYIDEIVRWITRDEQGHWEHDETGSGTWLYKESVE